jgi:hypothetical protein
MITGAVKGIDIIIKKKPSGHMMTMQLVDTGNGTLKVTNIVGGEVADHHRLRQIGGLVGALLTGGLADASIRLGPTGRPDIQMSKTTAIVKSVSNIKTSS